MRENDLSNLRRLGLALGYVIIGWLLVATVWAQRPPHAEVHEATRTDTSKPLRDMPASPPLPAILGEIFERPRKLLPNREGAESPGAPDPVVQESGGGPSLASIGAGFGGIGNVNSVLPPDPTGAIGPNHYVQMVNLSLAIYDRNGNVLMGPANSNSIWSGFGGPCQSSNDGDPMVVYDHLADRFMISQFALPRFPRGPFYQCIAVSQGPDPTGPWHRYEFTISSSKLNDYPKFGLWPDGYYMSVNQFKCSILSCSWGGAGVAAFERDQMLSGGAARMVFFDLQSVDPNLGGMLPADLDGPPPPSGAANIFAQMDDNAWGYSADQLQLWAFHVDWANPSASTFTHTVDLPTQPFDSNLCGYSRTCIPQGGTTYKVDTLADRLMFRLQYRNFGDRQTLVVNHSVDVNGNDRAGIRWYELRNTGAGWGIHQQGTYAPGSEHRWMGSIAMNGNGDIGLGFSITGSGLLPSIRAAGRFSGDPAGTLPQGEANLITGGGYQTHSAARWGDYSHLSVDPTDDCTFWYTQEYYAAPSSAGWSTHIGSFKLRDCTPAAAHDIVVNSVSASSPAVVGVEQQVSVYLSNVGANSESVALTLTDSLGATISGTQDFNLAGGSTDTRSFTWTPTAPGTHVLTATAPITSDSTPTNNSASVNVTVDAITHDVAVTSVTAPASATVNVAANVDVLVSNLGNQDENVTLTLSDSLGATISGPQNFNLAAGSATTRTFTWTPTAVGPHTLTAQATTIATDANTSNNSKTASSNVSDQSPAPLITGISPGSLPRNTSSGATIKGSNFVAGATVSFISGSGPAPSVSNVVVADGSTITLTISVPKGGPKGSSSWTVQVTNPDGQSAQTSFIVTP